MAKTLEARVQELESKMAPVPKLSNDWMYIARGRSLGQEYHPDRDEEYGGEAWYRNELSTMSPEDQRRCEEYLQRIHEIDKGKTLAKVTFCAEFFGNKINVDVSRLTETERQHYTPRLEELRREGDFFVQFDGFAGKPGLKHTWREGVKRRWESEAEYREKIAKLLRDGLEKLRRMYRLDLGGEHEGS